MTTQYPAHSDQRPAHDRRRALQALLGVPMLIAVTAVAGCADMRPTNTQRPKSYITGHGGLDDKSTSGGRGDAGQ